MTESLHERLAGFLERTGVLGAAMRVRRVSPRATLTIVTFHRIAEPAAEPYDPDVVDATPAQFRRHVEVLARFGTPIGIETLVRALDGAPLPRNAVMITFDDGYRSSIEIALPILRELGVPATFFIATGFVTRPRLYWWEQIAAIVRLARGRRATIAYPRRLEVDCGDPPAARRLLDNTVKNTYRLELDRFLAELRAALGVPWSPGLERELAAPLIMSWDDIRALAAAGMDVESHTRDHRVLETLDHDALIADLVGARRDLEAELRRPVHALAYPVGRTPSARVRRAVAEAGYRIALSNTGGINHARMLDRFNLCRISTERSSSDALFLAQVALPALTQPRAAAPWSLAV